MIRNFICSFAYCYFFALLDMPCPPEGYQEAKETFLQESTPLNAKHYFYFFKQTQHYAITCLLVLPAFCDACLNRACFFFELERAQHLLLAKQKHSKKVSKSKKNKSVAKPFSSAFCIQGNKICKSSFKRQKKQHYPLK